MSTLTWLLNKTVVAKRRTGGPSGSTASLNVLGEPVYGENVSTWTTIYPALKCRIEIYKADIEFKEAGERVPPTNVMYTDPNVVLQVEDRIIDGSDVYIVQGRQTAYDVTQVVHHYEYNLLVA